MHLKALTSTPLRPISTRARSLSVTCDELLIATAFVSTDAVSDVIGSALENGGAVRFITGTFGRMTRLATFRHIHRLASSRDLAARVWSTIGNRDLHVKLFIWRHKKVGTAWIGSANLTNRGLQADGELMAELRGSWTGDPIRVLRNAFEAEWRKGSALDTAFLRTYREAPRAQHLLAAGKSRKGPRPRVSARGLLVLPIAHHFPDDGSTATRIDARLGGTAASWYRGRARALRTVAPGDVMLLVDVVDRKLRLVVATDRVRDGNSWVVAHEPLGTRSERPLTVEARRKLSKLGLSTTTAGFRTQRVEGAAPAAIVTAAFGRAKARIFDAGR